MKSTAWKLFWVIFLTKLCILALILGVWGQEKLLWGDSPLYIDIGNNIFNGQGFSTTRSDGTLFPNTERTPIYPFLVGLFSFLLPAGGAVVLSFLQIAVAAGSAVLMYQIALFVLPKKWAVASALLFSFEPLLLFLHMLLLPDTLLVFFVLLFTYFFLTYLRTSDSHSLVYSAATLGIAVLTKPIAIYLFLVPLILLFFFKREFARASTFLLVVFIILFPWMAYNYARAGTFDITGNDYKNICGWGLTGVLSTAHGLDSSNWAETWALPEYADVQMRCTSTGAAIKIFVAEYPSAFAKTLALSTASLLTNEGYTSLLEKPAGEQVKVHHNYLTPAVFTNTEWREKFSAALEEFNIWQLIVIFGAKLMWTTVSILALVGSFLLIKNPQKRLEGIFLTLAALYFVAVPVISTAFGVSARLRYPADSFLLILAAYALWWLYERIWIRRNLTTTTSATTQSAGL